MKHFVVLITVLVFITGCSDSGNNRYNREFQLDESSFDDSAMQMIKRDTGLSIPDGARGLNFAYKPPIDPSFLARIEIPNESHEFMISQISALKENIVNTSGGLTERIEWWRPSQGTVLAEKDFYNDSNGSRLHVILLSENGRLILYICKQT